jgi:hypothetical protein
MQFFFALVDPTDATFTQTFARNDWTVLSFRHEHKEGEFAKLSLEIKNPGAGLLSGKVWLWFSYQLVGAGTATPLFFGRIVGIPSSILQEAVTVELTGKPADFNDQKTALADTLRVLPWYDEIFIDKARREDPDVVLEAYSRRWHIDPVTHTVTASDIIEGEDGQETFDADEMLYDGFDLSIGADIPLRSVKIDAELNWTQLGQGSLDMSAYIQSNWPNETPGGYITSFTLREGSWPSPGSSIGDNWTVGEGQLRPVYDLTVRNQASGGRTIAIWPDVDSVDISVNESHDRLIKVPPDSIFLNPIFLTDTSQVTYGDDGDGGQTITSWTISQTWTSSLLALGYFIPGLTVNYQAERPHTERVTFTMGADVQAIVTMAGEDEALLIDDIRSVNLSEPISDETGAEIPIEDPRRRSYICTARGQQSLTHLLLLARAHLLRRARAVEVTFEPTLDRLGDISLRKNAVINDSRIPGGQAEGKIVAWRFALDGDSGEPELLVTIGCAVGNGGTVVAVPGTGDWVEADYVEVGYQEAVGTISAFNDDVGFEVPLFNPNDDGIDFISGVTAEDAIEQALVVVNPPATQRAALLAAIAGWGTPGLIGGNAEQRQALLDSRTEAMNAALQANETVATFKLRSMRKEFESPYPINVEDLVVPQQIDLAA